MTSFLRSRAAHALTFAVAIGLVANGCGKGGSGGGGGPTGPLLAEFVVVSQPVQVLQGQTTTLQLKVTYNGQVLSSNQYSVSASIDNPNVGSVSTDSNKNVQLQANSLIGVTTLVRASIGYNNETTAAIVQVQVVNQITNSTIEVNGVPKTVQTNSTGHTIEVRLNQGGVLSNPLQTGNQWTIEVINNPNNVGLVQIQNSTLWEFRPSGNTGTIDLRVKVTNVNGFSGQRDFIAAFTVNTTGGGGGGGGSNEVNGPVFTALNVSSPGGQANAGQPFQMNMNATRDGTSTSDTKEVNWMVDNNSLDQGIASIDAMGRLFVRNTGATVQVSTWAAGIQTASSPERWREMIQSNTQSVTSSGTLPTGLMLRYCPSFLPLGSRKGFEIIDCDTGNDVTLSATTTITDLNGNTVTHIQRVNNSQGQSRVLEALRPGLVRVNFTTGAKSGTFHIRVGTSNPHAWQRNSKGVIDPMMFVCDPYENPSNTNEWKQRYGFNLKYAANRNNPSVYFFNDNVNGTTPPDEVIPLVQDEFGDWWAVFERTGTGTSGTFDTGDFQPVGNSTSPINTSATTNEYFRNKEYCAAQSSTSDNLRLNVTRSAPVGGPLKIIRFQITTFN